MKSCSRVIAFIFVVLFLVSAPLCLLMFNMDSFLLTPKPYLQGLEDADFATRLPEIAAEQIQYSMTFNPCLENPGSCEGGEGGPQLDEGGPQLDEGGPPAYLRNLTSEQWKTILAVLLEPGWLETQSDQLLTGLFNNLEPGAAAQPIQISLVDLKQNLAGPRGIDLINELLAAQPACTPAQVLELAGMDLSQPDFDRLLSCNPPPEVVAAIMPELRNALSTAANDIPASMDVDILNSLFDRSASDSNHELPLVRARLILRFSPFISLAFLFLTGLFAVRSVRSLGFWIGIPLLIAGGGMAAVGWLAPGAIDWAVERFFVPALPDMLSPVTSGFVLDLLLRVGKLMADRIAFQAVVMAIIGAGLLIIALLAKPRRQIDGIAPLTKPRDRANEGT